MTKKQRGRDKLLQAHHAYALQDSDAPLRTRRLYAPATSSDLYNRMPPCFTFACAIGSHLVSFLPSVLPRLMSPLAKKDREKVEISLCARFPVLMLPECPLSFARSFAVLSPPSPGERLRARLYVRSPLLVLLQCSPRLPRASG